MPASGKVLLDTNIIIALFAGEQAVLDQLKNATEIFIPCIVIGELFFGAKKSSQAKRNNQRIEAFIAGNIILPCDAMTGFHYGSIKEQLQKIGKPIPENDIWIAAIARQYDCTLVSRDEHFLYLKDLTVERW